jgi:hypothetical protein
MDISIPSYHDLQDASEIEEITPTKIKVPKLQLTDLPTDILPDAIQEFVIDVAKDEKTTLINSTVAFISIAGAVIGSKIGIRAKGNNSAWKEIANISGLIVGDSGVRKSGALEVAKGLLLHLEKGYAEYNAQIKKEYQLELARKQLEIKKIKKASDIDESKIALQAEIKEMEQQGYPTKLIQTTDSTIESLQNFLQHRINNRGIIVIRDEISSLISLMLSPAKDADRTFYMNGTKGLPHKVTRVGRGVVDLGSLTLSSVGTVQTKLFKNILAKWKVNFGYDGFFELYLPVFVWAIPYQPKEYHFKQEVRDEMKTLFEKVDAYEIDDVMGNFFIKDEDTGIYCVKFNSQAQVIFNAFDKYIETFDYPTGQDYTLFHSWMRKQKSMVLRVSLIFHVLEEIKRHKMLFIESQISEITLLRAIALHEYIVSHAKVIFSETAEIELSEDKQCAIEILKQIRDGKVTNGMTAANIVNKKWAKLKDKVLVEQGLQLLSRHHWITLEETEVGSAGVPTTKLYFNNNAQTLVQNEANYIVYETPEVQTEYLTTLRAMLDTECS